MLLLSSTSPGRAQVCAPLQECGDVDDSGSVVSTDALKVLRKAVGQPQPLICQCTDGADDCAADLEACAVDLGDCITDLGSCGDARGICEGDLAVCEDNSNACTMDLAEVTSNLDARTNELEVCEGDLLACQQSAACGNANVDGSEECDLGDLAGESCATQGFAGGKLDCGSGCNFDTSGCFAARFVDNADGTITDHETGLMWEKKASRDAASDFANAHDADNSYAWAGACSTNTSKQCQPGSAASAACAANADGGTTGCVECDGDDGVCNATRTIWSLVVELNDGGFAGHTDWRVPTRAELQGILDYGNALLAVDEAFWTEACYTEDCTDIADPTCGCPLLASGSWSASAHASNPGASAWALSEGNGDMAFVVRTFLFQVRAVRGGS